MNSKRLKLQLAIIGGLTWAGLQPMGANQAKAEGVSDAMYQSEVATQQEIQQVGFLSGSACDASPVYEDSSCGCEETSGGLFGSLGGGSGCEDYGCGGCDEGGGVFADGLFDCDLGEPFSLFGEAGGISAGGWAQFGYHNKNLPLFNSRADEYQLHQFWLYAEKAIDTSSGFDFGGRVDYVYGTDAQDTQAFGIDNDHWDNDWDNGAYGHALPQVYGEAGYGDFSMKFGHFFTIIGYEVVAAPDNFFYSHAYTMYNSEPFTHSGALATYNISDDMTMYAGWTFGWDSGFEDNGDSFLGGISMAVSDHMTVTYATTAGRFNENINPGGARISERGYMHSIVSDVALTDKLQLISQSDFLQSEGADGTAVRDTMGLNNYLIYTVSDCLALGSRLEWWNIEVAGQEYDVLDLTLGVNYKPHANILVRPEIRWDWLDGNEAALAAAGGPTLDDGGDSQTTFGIDTIFLF